MVELILPPPDGIRNGLSSVIEGAIAGGAPAPSWVAIDDGTDAWVAEVSRRSPGERLQGVVAAGGDIALAKAQRLGIGGAMRLPPSSLGALEAFSAAAAAELPVVSDAAAVELLEGSSVIHVASFADSSFWRGQLGDRALVSLLVELASALGTPAAILTWPALVVADRDSGEIVRAWEQIVAESGGIGPAVAVRSPDTGAGEQGMICGACAALLENSVTLESSNAARPQPIHELPHGRRVGWWCLERQKTPEEPGWFATPIETTPTRRRWRFDGTERSGIVEEVLSGEEITELDGAVAARMPGWASRDLRPGSPAGLLAARIAEAAVRRGLPLWIPNIDDEALPLVLGLPGVIWVDGPAVPS